MHCKQSSASYAANWAEPTLDWPASDSNEEVCVASNCRGEAPGAPSAVMGAYEAYRGQAALEAGLCASLRLTARCSEWRLAAAAERYMDGDLKGCCRT